MPTPIALQVEPLPRSRPWPVSLVGAGAGDVTALTLGAADVLAAADVVFADDLVDASVLARIPAGVEVVAVGKRGGRPSFAQSDIVDRLIDAARQNRRVVRLKGGDPMLYGRGAEEAEALVAAGLEVAIYPGISAAFAAASATGIPLTYRNVASQVSFITAIRADGSQHPVDDLAGPGRTLVVYMGRFAARQIANALGTAGVPSWFPAAVIENAGRPDQTLVATTVEGLSAAVASLIGHGPVLLIVGEVVAKRVACTTVASAHFAHG